MFVFVSGGVRSGKSAWAEKCALSLSREGTPRVYLATARAGDQEMRERVLHHQAARANKGFKTWERDVDVSKVLPRLTPATTLLLECLGTLLANEMFGKETYGANEAEISIFALVEKIYGEILSLKAKAANLLVVSNDIFMDGSAYDETTENYRRALGALHIKLAREAHLAVECVCGRATIFKTTL